MSLFDLALRNVRRSFRNYVTYLASTTASVGIFYVFYSIAYSQQFVDAAARVGELKMGFVASAIVIAVFSVMFVWYSNGFFVRVRKREIGMYALFGMTRRQIGRMFFYENLTLGLLSLAVGLTLGITFSKFSAMLLIFVMGLQANVAFEVVPQALKITTAVFLGVFLLTAVQSYGIIYRFKLVELFRAEREGERAPRASVILAVVGLVLITAGYFVAVKTSGAVILYAIPILVLVIAGTYMLFNSAVVLLVRRLRRWKRFYYSGVNLISTSQLLFRIKGNARMLATIAIVSAVTLTAVGTTYTLYMGSGALVRLQYPYSLLYIANPAVEEVVNGYVDKHPEVKVRYVDRLEVLGGIVTVTPPKKDPFEIDAYIIAESALREASAHAWGDNIPRIKSDDDVLTNGTTFRTVAQGALPGINGDNRKLDLNVGGTNWQFTMSDRPVRDILNAPQARAFLVAVTDRRFAELRRGNEDAIVHMTGYLVEDPATLAGLAPQIRAVMPPTRSASTYYTAYSNNKQLFGAMVYIGTFLGLVFFLATGSIIYFKQLVEAYSDRQRYQVLSSIGVSTSDIRQAVARQLSLVFALPLGVGIAHSFFALTALRQILEIDILPYTTLVTVVYVVLYVGYYFVGVNSYTRIVTGGSANRS